MQLDIYSIRLQHVQGAIEEAEPESDVEEAEDVRPIKRRTKEPKEGGHICSPDV
jgi:hypothetical protein